MTDIISTDRLPPCAPEIEASILGAMLLDNRCIGDVTDHMGGAGGRFYEARHAHIYDAILAVYAASIPADQITVNTELTRRGTLDAVGGVVYLAELAGGVASAANAGHHAKIVADAAYSRGLAEAYIEGAQAAYKPGADPGAVQEAVEVQVFGLSEHSQRGEMVGIGVAVTEAAAQFDYAHMHKGLIGIPTGLRDLDGLNAGWQRTDLIIIAARPSVGKTAMVLGHVMTAADSGIVVVIFSLEMSRSQLAQRLTCMRAGIDLHKMRTGKATAEDHQRAATAYAEIHKLPIHIDDTRGTNPMGMRAKLRRLAQRHELGLVVVDYLQLMESDVSGINREQEVSGYSRGLKGLAKEFDVPVIALAQLNRESERRTSHRPVLSDLRDSGAIEQDADSVNFLYRAEKHGITEDDSGSTKGIAEIIVAKQRNGPTGMVKVQFDEASTAFRDLAPAYLRT